MHEVSSLTMSREQRKAESQKQQQTLAREVGSWLPTGRSLELNLDFLNQGRREQQIKAMWRGAEDTFNLTQGLDATDRIQTTFTLKSNPLRLLEQFSALNHTGAAVDKQASRLWDRVTGKTEKRPAALPENRTSIRKKVVEFYSDSANRAAVFGAEGLRSKSISDREKRAVIRNIQELFTALGKNNTKDSETDTLRTTIVRELAQALPDLSPGLQEELLRTIATLQEYFPVEVRTEPLPDVLSINVFLQEMSSEKFAKLDPDAKIAFLRNIKPDIYSMYQLSHLLGREANPAVLQAAIEALKNTQYDQTPDSQTRVSYGVGRENEWQNIVPNERTKLLAFYQKVMVQNLLHAKFDPTNGLEVLQALVDKRAVVGDFDFSDEIRTALYNDRLDSSILRNIPDFIRNRIPQSESSLKKEEFLRESREIIAGLSSQIRTGVENRFYEPNRQTVKLAIEAYVESVKILKRVQPAYRVEGMIFSVQQLEKSTNKEEQLMGQRLRQALS